MPQSDQGVTNDRYTVIPPIAKRLRRGKSYLLLKGALRFINLQFDGMVGVV
jgi:hypothetical protein